MSEFESVQQRNTRKAQLIQNLYKVKWLNLVDGNKRAFINVEDLLELMRIVAHEVVEELDAEGFFDTNHDPGEA